MVQIVTVGRIAWSLGEIVYVHVLDDVYDIRTGRINISRLRPAGRLAANEYAHVHDRFEMKCSNEYNRE